MENEKLDFFDVSRIVAGTDRRVRYKEGIWWKWLQEPGRAAVLVADEWHTSTWWPTIEQQKEKCWQVEPERPKDIFVWAKCSSHGESFLWRVPPPLYPSTDDLGKWLRLTERNLFSAGESIKYRLIPADETCFVILEVKGDDVYIRSGDRSLNLMAATESTLLNWSKNLLDEIPRPELNDA